MQRPLTKTDTSDSKGKNLIQCLSTCDLGTELVVLKVDAGHMAKHRLGELGIVPGVKIVKKKAAPFKGPVEIEVRGSSLVIGRGLASKIIVQCNSTCSM